MSDLALLDLLLVNDSSAWQEFVRRFDRLVWRCIMKVTNRFVSVINNEDLREIHGNFYGMLMANNQHKLRMFKPERGNKLGTWIGMLAINCAWDYLRSVARQPAHEALSFASDRASESPDPFEQTAQRETCATVERLLSSFSHKDRTFVLLYFVESRSAEEIADEMGISVKTVYSKKHKIRTRLEKLLEEQGLSIAA
ncbi:MAG: sigma-70 family RNA polymerase sigma factor [Deltaproteobacteria bacterium]|nr:sigma-70 family RNA polymerase sigma factor [Deltaproteobacteria bacterium]